MAQRYCEGVGVPTMLGRLKRWLLAMLALPPPSKHPVRPIAEASAVSEEQGCAWLRCRREERRF
jgi:hypothetical protein